MLVRFLLFAGLLLTGPYLTAQSFWTDSPLPSANNRLQISFTISPEITRTTYQTLYVRATDTVAMDDFLTVTDILRERSRQELITTEGENLGEYFVETGYSNGNGRLDMAKPHRSLRAVLQLHYRYKSNIEMSFGLNYAGSTSRRTIAPTANLPTDFFYETQDATRQSGGVTASVTYHFLPRSRLQPYAGLITYFNVSSISYKNRVLASPFSDQVIAQTINERFRTNTLLDFDSELLVGFQYRLYDRWSVGLQSGTLFTGRAYGGDLQIRYLLSRGQS